MKSLIRYLPEDIQLNLEKPDLGHPDGLAIVARHHRQSTRRSMGFNRDNPAFLCEAHIGGTNPGLFIRYYDSQWWATHYEKGACQDKRLPALMSDEHKRQTEYWARAAQAAGWAVDLEHALPTGTRPDALIFGPVLTGVEVQRSAMTLGAASQRTRKALAAGVTDLWYTAAGISLAAGKLSPKWAHRLPTVGSDDMPWTAVPPARAATATGLRRIIAIKCIGRNFSLCPETGRRLCGKTHAIPEAWRGMTVDDVAAQFPAGEIVALRMRGNSRTGSVFLVSAKDALRYEELTGYRAPAPISPAPRTARSPGRVECANDQLQALLPLYVPVTGGQVGSQIDAPGTRGTARKKAGSLCVTCGYPMPGSACNRQACKVARHYQAAAGEPS